MSRYTNESTDPTLRLGHNKYRLYGIVNHMGYMSGGHYTADCMNEFDKNWYTFDDDRVSRSRAINAKDAYGNLESSNSYLLFYAKQDLFYN